MIWFITFVIVYTTKDFRFMYPVVFLFWIQFWVAVIRWPRYAPISILWWWIVRKQQPDYVWAIQKRFARWLWRGMATLMIIVTIWFGMIWIVPFLICRTCLILMRMESTMGICVWCKIYYKLLQIWWIKEPKVQPACPWGACSIDWTWLSK